ncbi:hypothetical protein LCGC14_2774120, partial [marine sediment metagenome]
YSHIKRDGKAYTRNKILAEWCGISVPTFNRHIRQLEDRGIVQRSKASGRLQTTIMVEQQYLDLFATCDSFLCMPLFLIGREGWTFTDRILYTYYLAAGYHGDICKDSTSRIVKRLCPNGWWGSKTNKPSKLRRETVNASRVKLVERGVIVAEQYGSMGEWFAALLSPPFELTDCDRCNMLKGDGL